MTPDLLSERSEDVLQSDSSIKQLRHETQAQLRARVIRKYNSRCFYCGKHLGYESEPTLDHVIPTCKGGKTRENNLVAACVECNRDKGAMTLEEYRLATFIRTPVGTCVDHIQKALQVSLGVPGCLFSRKHHCQLLKVIDAIVRENDLRFYWERTNNESLKSEERKIHVN